MELYEVGDGELGVHDEWAQLAGDELLGDGQDGEVHRVCAPPGETPLVGDNDDAVGKELGRLILMHTKSIPVKILNIVRNVILYLNIEIVIYI